MNEKPTPTNHDPKPHDVHHDESRLDLRASPSGGNTAGKPDDVSRDQNHDESRINAFHPEVAKSLKMDNGSGSQK